MAPLRPSWGGIATDALFSGFPGGCEASRLRPPRHSRPKAMPTHAEKRFLPYSPDQLFELVASVDRYPEFLPWCIASRIRSRDELPTKPPQTLIIADLVIGF